MLESLLAGIYLQFGLAAYQPTPTPNCGGRPTCYYVYDINKTVNPYGTVELGYEHSAMDDESRFTYGIALRHASSIPAQDHGQNSLEFHIKFHPFK